MPPWRATYSWTSPAPAVQEVTTVVQELDFGVVGSAIELSVAELTPDVVRAQWTVTPAVHQPAGILHGGLHCWVVETLASLGALTWLAERGTVVGVSNQTDFYRATREGRLTSTATPVHRGRSQQVWVIQTQDDEGRLVARGQVRLQNLAAR